MQVLKQQNTLFFEFLHKEVVYKSAMTSATNPDRFD